MLTVSSDVINAGQVLTMKAGAEADFPATRQSVYIATDTNHIWYRDRFGNPHLLGDGNTGGSGGGGGDVVDVRDYNANGTYTLAQGYILKRYFLWPGSDATMRLGLSADGNELLDDTDVTTADGLPGIVAVVAKNADTNIYVQGCPPGTKVIFLKQLILAPVALP